MSDQRRIERPSLRLAGCDPGATAQWVRADRIRREVAAENRRAATAVGLDPTDPRWTLAVRTQSQLQGTLLTPERRDRVLRTARALGVRPFEANIIIALVQDHARRGLPLAEVRTALAEVPPAPCRAAPRASTRLLLALATAALLTLLISRWILG